MKKYLLLFTIISPLLFMSCENNGGEMSDDELIEAIINAENRISVTKNDLPKSAIASLGFKMPNDIIRFADLAPELGYEIEMKSWDFIDFELDYERDDNQYFATNGRKLESTRGNKDGWGKGKDDKKKKRGPCFKFVYPISYTMGDGSVISGNDRKEICTKMRAYFEQNGKPKTRKDKPQLNFPVQILIFDENKKVITKDLASYDDLKLAWESCKGKKGDKGNGDRKG